jgi:hypothetical protein
MQNTAIPANDSLATTILAPANIQGAGLVNIYNAIKSTISVSPAKLPLGERASRQCFGSLVVEHLRWIWVWGIEGHCTRSFDGME